MASISHDWFMVAADFDAYAKTQRKVDAVWRNGQDWYSRAIRNTARMGWFSSDRTIRQYAREIWNVPVRYDPAKFAASLPTKPQRMASADEKPSANVATSEGLV